MKWWHWASGGLLGCALIIGSIAYLGRQPTDQPEVHSHKVLLIVNDSMLRINPDYHVQNVSSIDYLGRGKWQGKFSITGPVQYVEWKFYEKSRTVEFLTDVR